MWHLTASRWWAIPFLPTCSLQLRPELHIVARAETDELLKELYELGVHEVVLPRMEAGLEVTRQALLHLNVPERQVERFADEVRREFYRTDY